MAKRKDNHTVQISITYPIWKESDLGMGDLDSTPVSCALWNLAITLSVDDVRWVRVNAPLDGRGICYNDKHITKSYKQAIAKYI